MAESQQSPCEKEMWLKTGRPELCVVDLAPNESEDAGMELDTRLLPCRLNLLCALLPPALSTHRLTPLQRSHQIFPLNMAPSHAARVYTLTLLLAIITSYTQHQLFYHFYPILPHSIVEWLFYVSLIGNEIFYFYFVVYPMFYAVVLRWEDEDGRWPTSLGVWGSRAMQGEEEEMRVKWEGRVRSWWDWVRMAREYTFYGVLGRRERGRGVFLEDGEGIVEKRLE